MDPLRTQGQRRVVKKTTVPDDDHELEDAVRRQARGAFQEHHETQCRFFKQALVSRERNAGASSRLYAKQATYIVGLQKSGFQRLIRDPVKDARSPIQPIMVKDPDFEQFSVPACHPLCHINPSPISDKSR
ncbi:MAG: hypothetical protein V5B38_06910 [Candidatus Accumulibacter propinquus]